MRAPHCPLPPCHTPTPQLVHQCQRQGPLWLQLHDGPRLVQQQLGGRRWISPAPPANDNMGTVQHGPCVALANVDPQKHMGCKQQGNNSSCGMRLSLLLIYQHTHTHAYMPSLAPHPHASHTPDANCVPSLTSMSCDTATTWPTACRARGRRVSSLLSMGDRGAPGSPALPAASIAGSHPPANSSTHHSHFCMDRSRGSDIGGAEVRGKCGTCIGQAVPCLHF